MVTLWHPTEAQPDPTADDVIGIVSRRVDGRRIVVVTWGDGRIEELINV